MAKWDFFDLLEQDKQLQADPKWIEALEAARKSRATPYQSKFHVNAGAVTKSGNVVYGSNHEIAITDTITHGEEAVIAAALEKYGPEDPIRIIAFATKHLSLSPCGNCRDAIKQYTDLEKLVIIAGEKDGGKAVVVDGKSFFYDSFKKSDVYNPSQLLSLAINRGIEPALKAESVAYDIYSSDASPKVYGAAIVCGEGLAFRGSFMGDCAYHPILPIEAAIINFRDGSDNKARKDVKAIVVASRDRIPDVLYKDRQHALEFAEAIQALNGKAGQPLPVYLANYTNRSPIPNVFETNTREWLPFAFSPANLGLDGQMAEKFGKLFL